MRVARTIADLRERRDVGRDEILAAASLRDRTVDPGQAA
jgi:predicted ATPase with chaperone activity